MERFPIRHKALSLCTEDVKAHYDALTPETRERLKNVLSQKGSGSRHERLSGACSRLSQNLSKSSPACVSWCSCEKERTHESEIDLPVEPLTSCDQATDEHDVIPHTRKRRRLVHKPHVSARFSVDFDEGDAIQVQADCSVPAFAENLVEKRAVVGTIYAYWF